MGGADDWQESNRSEYIGLKLRLRDQECKLTGRLRSGFALWQAESQSGMCVEKIGMGLKLNSASAAIFFESNPLVFVFEQIFIFFIHMGRLAIIHFFLDLFCFGGIHFQTPKSDYIFLIFTIICNRSPPISETHSLR